MAIVLARGSSAGWSNGGNGGGGLCGAATSVSGCPSIRGESNPSSRMSGVEICCCLWLFERAAVVAAGMRRPNEDWELRRGVVSLFSYGDECVLVVLEDGREESRELVLRRVRHADGDGETCSPNSFSEGGGARRRPKVDQFPKRSMKPPPLGMVWSGSEEPLERLAFVGESASPLAEGADDASARRVGSVVGVWRLLGPDSPRRTGGGRPWRIVVGSAVRSSGKRSRSGYIFRETGTDSCIGGGSLMGSSLGVVTVVVVVGGGRTA